MLGLQCKRDAGAEIASGKRNSLGWLQWKINSRFKKFRECLRSGKFHRCGYNARGIFFPCGKPSRPAYIISAYVFTTTRAREIARGPANLAFGMCPIFFLLGRRMWLLYDNFLTFWFNMHILLKKIHEFHLYRFIGI
jgi:hypothetical protein